MGKEGKAAVEDILHTFGVLDNSLQREESSKIKEVKIRENVADVTINANGSEIILQVRNYIPVAFF